MADPTENTTTENILKVLSGNQFGVEVTLGDGTYSFGSGADADIQLLDVALQPLHGHIRLRDGKIEIKAAGGELATASGLTVSKEDESWHEIAQMDAITAGMSKFVIGGKSANWATMTPAPAPKQKPKLSLDGALAGLRALPRRVTYAIGGAVSLLALVAVLGSGGGDAMPRDGDMTTAEAVANLRQTIAAMPFAGEVTVTQRADNTLAIDGYVEDSVERRAIQNAVDESALPATLRIFVRETLRAEIEGTIESQAIPARFTLDPAGHLTLSGTVLDAAAVEKLVSSLETGVFGLASVTNDIRTADQILAELRELAQRSGLENLVIFRLDGLVVEATGIVPRDKMDNWVGLIGVYSSRFAEDIPLRSFVTLDEPAATGTDPVIIGTGPAAEAETGRMVAPEALTEPNEFDVQSLFAGQPLSTGTPVTEAIPDNLQVALDRLRALRPDLFTRLAADIDAGRTPETALLQEALTAIGGSLENTGATENGTPVVEVVVPDIGSLGSLEQIAAAMRRAFANPAPEAAAEDTSATLAPLMPETSAPSEVTARAAEILSAPATVATSVAPQSAPPLFENKIEPEIEPETVDAAPADLPAPPPVVAPARLEAEVPAPAASDPAPQTVQTAAGELPLFALPLTEPPAMGQMVAAADALMKDGESQQAIAGGSLSANLFALVAMQHDQLEMGKTLLQLPKPLSALPFPVETPTGCWPGSKITPEMLPTALLLLDVLSVNADLDLARIDPDLRDLIMETALSPDRVRACLAQIGNSYSQMIGSSSAFLNESGKNPMFAEFLFRNIPRDDVPIVGANLLGERYIELTDGRKLREGAAPDVSRRILSISDLGILVRTAEGTKVQLFGENLGWRVVDACSVVNCEGN